ncbi:acetate--CoA ligase family protein [Deferrisoma palaeochoriense]
MNRVEKAARKGRTLLTEHESKRLLARYGIPVTREILVERREALVHAAREIGYPVALKACSPELAHKTENDLIRLDIRSDAELLGAYDAVGTRMGDGQPAVLVQEMVRGPRELAIGLIRDPQFGPCVMFGLGGIFTEILRDVTFRMAPIGTEEAREMMREIRGRRILEGVRGMEAADPDRLAEILVRVGRIGIEHGAIREIDINPVILCGGQPVAVDALIVLDREDKA